MKKGLFICMTLLLTQIVFSQQKGIDNKKQIKEVLEIFMNAIETKDSIKIYSLFHDAPVAWVGVYKEMSQNKILEKDNTKINSFRNSDYKTWFRKIMKGDLKQESFYNVEIIEDGAVASVTFDYSFWLNGKKNNWGKEFWHMIKVNENWKIVSVVFSMDMEDYFKEPESTYNNPKERIQNMINELMLKSNLPGLSIAISKKGELVYAEGFGYADVENKIPVTTKTQFRTASVAKVITSTAVAKLAQENKLDLEKSIQEYLPFLPYKKFPITSMQLAGHIGGITEDDNKNDNMFYATVRDGLNVFINKPLISEPGLEYNYSTPGFTLLSAVIEKTTNMSYLDYLKIEILIPLKMNNTDVDLRLHKPNPNLAKLYNLKDGLISEVVNPEDVSYKWAGGGLISTPKDLVSLTYAYKNGFIKPGMVNKMFSSQELKSGEKTQVGIGWRLSKTINGTQVYEHAGGMEGARTVICYFPEEEIAIALMTNARWTSSIEETAHMLAHTLMVKKTLNGLPKGEFNIKATIKKSNEADLILKGKILSNAENSQLILEDGKQYSIIHLDNNNYAFITTQGIYYLKITIKDKFFSGEAIMYGTRLSESPINESPFFKFETE